MHGCTAKPRIGVSSRAARQAGLCSKVSAVAEMYLGFQRMYVQRESAARAVTQCCSIRLVCDGAVRVRFKRSFIPFDPDAVSSLVCSRCWRTTQRAVHEVESFGGAAKVAERQLVGSRDIPLIACFDDSGGDCSSADDQS